MSEARRAAPAKTLIEEVYKGLKAEILKSDLEPGAKLPVEELRARYAVSSSTMREALLLLVSDGLATAVGQRGFRVAPMSFDDLVEITSLRKLLEGVALREAIAHGDDRWEAEIVSTFHRLSRVAEHAAANPDEAYRIYAERNLDFHEALTAACPSRWLQHFRRIIFQASERYRIRYRLALSARPGVDAEHRAIMDAALAGNAELAARLSDQHIDASFEAVTRGHDIPSSAQAEAAQATVAPLVRRRRRSATP